MRNYLLRGKLNEFGIALDKAWNLKRQFSAKVTSNYLDKIYSDAKMNGAIGGKLLGAGGGGFFLFYTSPFSKHDLIEHLESSDLKPVSFRFESNGLQSGKYANQENNLQWSQQTHENAHRIFRN